MRAEHVLVTGAAGAIGSAVAARLAHEAPNARLSLVDKNPISHAFGNRAHTFMWDLAEPHTLDAAWHDATKDASKPVDVLVNCAGFMELRTFAGTPWPLGKALLDVDLVSPLRLMSLAMPSMCASGYGVVVNVTSMAGVVPLRGSSYYGAAKAGLAMASEIARIELKSAGIRVLTVYPGPVASELERRARAQVRPTFAARAIPTGDPNALADAIVRALRHGASRVIYPSIYGAAAPSSPWLSIARRFTETFSPAPRI